MHDAAERMGTAVPTVSVLTCCFNGERWLARALDSAFAQSFQDFEVVFIDNGSTDASSAIAQRYSKDPRFRYTRQAHSFLPKARNHALRSARGRFLAVLDSDDVWPPGRLEQQLDFLRKHPEAGLVYGDAEHVDETGRVFFIRRQPEYPPPQVLRRLVERNFISLGTSLVRAECWRSAGFSDEDLFGADDYDLLLRMAARWPVVHIPEVTVQFRYHAHNTGLDARMFEDDLRILDKVEKSHPELAAVCRRKRGRIYYRRAGAAFIGSQWAAAKADYISAWKCNPLYWRTYPAFLRLAFLRWGLWRGSAA